MITSLFMDQLSVVLFLCNTHHANVCIPSIVWCLQWSVMAHAYCGGDVMCQSIGKGISAITLLHFNGYRSLRNVFLLCCSILPCNNTF